LQCLQNPSKINGDTLNNIRRETSRLFRNKKREYFKDKIDEVATNSKNKNIRTFEIFIEELITLRRVNNLEVT
jgi:hypothetical protein